MTFAGMDIVVSKPVIKSMPRTWRERLFTWPWRPFKKTKSVVFPAAVPTDQCYRIGNQLHCGEQFYDTLKKHADEVATTHRNIFYNYEKISN